METWPGVDQSTGIHWDNWMGEYQNARVDLTVWPTDTLAKALSRYLESEAEFCGLSHVILDFAYRLSIAVPLKNEAFFRRMWELLDRSSYRRSLARYVKAMVENCLTDVAGQLDSGDGASARLSAGLAAAKVADASLIWAGDYCRGEKWLLRRLEGKPECGIDANEYRSVVLDGVRQGESEADYALRVARWAQGHVVRLESEFLRVS
jgi:hypothetical protein